MNYLISTLVFGSPGVIEINKDEYSAIKNARENLFEALFLEEKLDLVTENYQEYEAELLAISSRMMVFHNSDYFSMGQERNLLSRRIVNLLSAGRMYLDQSAHHLKNIYGEGSEVLVFRENIKSEQYKQKFGYRVMEALRNYVQHRGFPIQTIVFSHRRIDNDDNIQFLHRAIPKIDITTLEEDRKFKKSILAEIKDVANKDTIDFRPLIREYVEGIGTLHEKIRDRISPDLLIWENLLDNTIAKYKSKFGENASLAGLAIIMKNENNKLEESKTIFKEFIKKRKDLENKNKSFINLHKSNASNEIRKDD